MDALLMSNASDTIVNLTVFPLNNILALWVVWILCSSQQEAHQQVVEFPSPPIDVDMLPQQLPEENTWLIPSRTSGWAIAAGYAGMFAIVPFLAPIALILGMIALRDCKKHSTDGRGRAIFAIVMGAIFSLFLLLFLLLLTIGLAFGE